MKTALTFMVIFIYALAFAAEPGKSSLSGTIRDKSTGNTLPGVVIYIPDLKTGTVSKADGTYTITDLPSTKLLVQVSFVGYKTILEQIDITVPVTRDFEMEVSVREIKEVVVTGHSQAADRDRTPTPISIVTKTTLLQNASTNIIDAIAQQPGVSQITTGSGISKPVIRGLGYNRVVVVNNGIRQEGQQWGDEHGIEVDEYSVNKIEILKGPASLSYGSDAIAGVLNIISDKTLPPGTIETNLLANYQSNNGLFGYSLNLGGNQKGFVWDVRYSDKRAHAYQNKYDGYVYNSSYRENNFSAMMGLNRSWGYSHLQFSSYSVMPGLVEGERDSASGKFIRPVVVNDSSTEDVIVDDEGLQSYSRGIPYQRVGHDKLVLSNSFVIGNGSLKLIAGFQQNRRKEYGDPFLPENYGLFFLMNTINYDLRYILPERNGLDISFGINGMKQSSENKGTEFLVPEYELFDIGLFTIVKKSFGKLDISGGLRYDTRQQQGAELYLDGNGNRTENPDTSSVQRFRGFSTSFSGISGSLGATYQFNEKVFSKLNIARGYRSPNIAELGSNGEHEGTMRYEIGNTSLKPETSLQLDLALGVNTEHVSVEVDLFSNMINDYVLSRKLSSVSGGDSLNDGMSTFRFEAADAELMGGEFLIDIHPHPLDWLHFENSFSYVSAKLTGQSDSTRYLPFSPPARLRSELRADLKKTGIFSGAYLKLGIQYTFEQDQIFSAYGTETETPAYLLLHCGAGTDLMIKEKKVLSFYITVNNLLDNAYQDHLSRLKYAPENFATGRNGVYNMGRNISFKLVVPLTIKS
jgi:iron complex outermembrane receptor protein